MGRAVGQARGDDLCPGAHAPTLGRLGRLHQQRHGGHAEDHAVAVTSKGHGCAVEVVLCGGRAEGQKTPANPGQQRGRRNVVGAHHHHAGAAPATDPVLGHCHRRRGGGARRVHQRIGPESPEQLRDVRVAESQDLQQGVAREGLGLRVPRGELEELFVAREGRGEDYARVLRKRGGQAESFAECAPVGHRAPLLLEGQPRISQHFKGRGRAHAGGNVPIFVPGLGQPVVFDQIERAAASDPGHDLLRSIHRL